MILSVPSIPKVRLACASCKLQHAANVQGSGHSHSEQLAAFSGTLRGGKKVPVKSTEDELEELYEACEAMLPDLQVEE